MSKNHDHELGSLMLNLGIKGEIVPVNTLKLLLEHVTDGTNPELFEHLLRIAVRQSNFSGLMLDLDSKFTDVCAKEMTVSNIMEMMHDRNITASDWRTAVTTKNTLDRGEFRMITKYCANSGVSLPLEVRVGFLLTLIDYKIMGQAELAQALLRHVQDLPSSYGPILAMLGM